MKLTPALRRTLELVARRGERGVMELQIVASGGRSASQLKSLVREKYVERVIAPFVERGRFEPDRVVITDAGRAALGES